MITYIRPVYHLLMEWLGIKSRVYSHNFTKWHLIHRFSDSKVNKPSQLQNKLMSYSGDSNNNRCTMQQLIDTATRFLNSCEIRKKIARKSVSPVTVWWQWYSINELRANWSHKFYAKLRKWCWFGLKLDHCFAFLYHMHKTNGLHKIGFVHHWSLGRKYCLLLHISHLIPQGSYNLHCRQP